jgi:hypothetical protein
MLEDRGQLLNHYRQTPEGLLAVIESLTDKLMCETTLGGLVSWPSN